jgi:hypothetical protein
VPGIEPIRVKPGEWIECSRFIGSFYAPPEDLPSCRVKSGIPVVDELGVVKSINTSQGVSRRDGRDQLTREAVTIITPKKADMTIHCVIESGALLCSL